MRAIYLICSAVSCLLVSALFSLVLALRFIPTFLFHAISSNYDQNHHRHEDGQNSIGGADCFGETQQCVWLYEGRVRHLRRRPSPHAFDYPVRYALVDLDRSSSSLPPSFFAGHESADRARQVTGTNGPVLLLTIPPSVGYEQNPLSVYYCYDLVATDREGANCPTTRLIKCIAEVTNTPWGERVSFVFSPGSDLVAKPLHVSPFMDMLGNWSILADAPGKNLFLEISVQHPTLGNYFTATLSAKRVSASPSMHRPTLFFWLMPHKVTMWIYWQALKLWWKGVSFVDHPRYLNPVYKEDALLRDQKMRCPCSDERDNNTDIVIGSSTGARWCVWRDAQWPWS